MLAAEQMPRVLVAQAHRLPSGTLGSSAVYPARGCTRQRILCIPCLSPGLLMLLSG